MTIKELLAIITTYPEDASVLVEEFGINDVKTVETEYASDGRTYVILVAAH